MTLAVTYDDALHLAGIGLAVWSRLGPEQWFPQYKILCGNVFDYDANFVLTEPTPAVRAATSTPGLLATPPFPKIVAGLRDYYFLTYKPFTRLPLEMSGRLVMNDPALARFENKRVFRELFADKLPIPEYQILPFDELNREGAAAAYRRFAAHLAQCLCSSTSTCPAGEERSLCAAPQTSPRRAKSWGCIR